MKKKLSLYWIILLPLFFLVVYSLLEREDRCIKTFDAYVFSKNHTQLSETVPPPAPWLVESRLPEYESEYVTPSVEITRMVESHIEIWVKTYTGGEDYFKFASEQYKFFIYRTDTKTWRTISAQIEGTPFFVGNLFSLKDGTVWGRVFWDTNSVTNLGLIDKPLLGKYNETTQKFEIVQHLQQIPTAEKERNFLHWSKVFVDSNDIIWIIAHRDAIYSYNPHTGKIIQQAELPNIFVHLAVLSSDGRIYIRELPRRGELEDHGIYQYLPNSGNVTKLEIQKEPWPDFGDMIVSRNGNLWMGAIGWREPNATWHRILPKSPFYWLKEKMLLKNQWFSPYVITESSNGYIWYKKDKGMAWYDPQKKDGCWFTTEYADNIIEDEKGNLWMVVNDVLYKHPPFP